MSRTGVSGSADRSIGRCSFHRCHCRMPISTAMYFSARRWTPGAACLHSAPGEKRMQWRLHLTLLRLLRPGHPGADACDRPCPDLHVHGMRYCAQGGSHSGRGRPWPPLRIDQRCRLRAGPSTWRPRPSMRAAHNAQCGAAWPARCSAPSVSSVRLVAGSASASVCHSPWSRWPIGVRAATRVQQEMVSE